MSRALEPTSPPNDLVRPAMAVRDAGPLADPAVIAASITALMGDLLAVLERTGG